MCWSLPAMTQGLSACISVSSRYLNSVMTPAMPAVPDLCLTHCPGVGFPFLVVQFYLIHVASGTKTKEMYVPVYAQLCVCMHVCFYVSMCMCVCVFVIVCKSLCVCVYVCICFCGLSV